MKVVLVHDWLIHMRGGEKVLESLAELYPYATIYTLFCHRRNLSPTLQHREIRTSFLQYLPGIRFYYRWLLPFFPFAMRTLPVPEADLIISSSHCVAKGIRKPFKTYHICYCHTPMRYAWGFEEDYFGKFPGWVKPMIRLVLKGLRKWDIEANQHVDLFIANSKNVQKRIHDCYNRDAFVVYPPLDKDVFVNKGQPKDYYLVVSAFVPYKRVDLAIQAFNELDRDLKIVGSGPLESTYRKMAKSARISFLGSVESSKLTYLYSEAKALIFPAEEDFGIVPLEAQACGTPVIAFRNGGAFESVRYGVFFDEQTPEAVRQAVSEFENMIFDRSIIPQVVSTFGKEQFKENFDRIVRERLTDQPS